MSLVRRSDLFDLIDGYATQFGKEIPNNIILDFENKESKIDKFQHIKYVDCLGLSNIILNYDESYRNINGKIHTNDIIGKTLNILDNNDFCCALYWN